MNSVTTARLVRKRRVRAKVVGNSIRPRLNVHISLRHISAQVIDDGAGITLAAISTVGKDAGKTLTQKAEWVGREIAAAATKAKVKQVVFDRGGRRFQGRLSALATAARDKGLEF